MPLTKEEKLAHRRVVDKANRDRKRAEAQERLVLLKENAELKMRILELEKENDLKKALVRYWRRLSYADNIFDYYTNGDPNEPLELIEWYEEEKYSNYIEPDFKEQWKERYGEEYPIYETPEYDKDEEDDDFTI